MIEFAAMNGRSNTELRQVDSSKQRRKERRDLRDDERRRRLQAQRRRQATLRWGAIAIGLAVVAGAIVFAVMQLSKPAVDLSALVPDAGANHIDRGQAHGPYTSVPPTSGDHWSIQGVAPWPTGVYTSPIPDEAQIHNLEHGNIAIQYNNLTAAEIKQLVDAVPSAYRTKILVAPYPNMQHRYALTAWTWIDTFDQFDDARIRGFVNAHINKGPECKELICP